MGTADHGGKRAGAGRPANTKPSVVLRLPLPVATLARRLAAGTLRAGSVNEFLDVETRTTSHVPLYGARVACGFPSPADDYLDRALDFNELLVSHPAATFAVRVQGESMTGAGIFPGDIAVVDRAITPSHGCIVLALIHGEFTIKRYCLRGGVVVLQAENPAFASIAINEEAGLEVWGVVRHAIRIF